MPCANYLRLELSVLLPLLLLLSAVSEAFWLVLVELVLLLPVFWLFLLSSTCWVMLLPVLLLLESLTDLAVLDQWKCWCCCQCCSCCWTSSDSGRTWLWAVQKVRLIGFWCVAFCRPVAEPLANRIIAWWQYLLIAYDVKCDDSDGRASIWYFHHIFPGHTLNCPQLLKSGTESSCT